MNYDELYADVGRRIRRAREKRGLNQDGLASAISLTRASISNIERGQQRLLIHTLCDIASALAVEPVSLVPSLSDLVGRQSTADDSPMLEQELEDALPSNISAQEWEFIRSTFAQQKKRE